MEAKIKKQPLTRRQQQILDFVREFIEEQGYSPSRVALAERFDISLGNVSRHIDVLVQKGHLEKDNSTRPPAMTVL